MSSTLHLVMLRAQPPLVNKARRYSTTDGRGVAVAQAAADGGRRIAQQSAHPALTVDALPHAVAIVVLGGGVRRRDRFSYADLHKAGEHRGMAPAWITRASPPDRGERQQQGPMPDCHAQLKVALDVRTGPSC